MTTPTPQPNGKANGHANGYANGVASIAKSAVPEWMAELGIKEGEYQYITKPQLRVLQRPGHSLKQQIWATLMLHAPGYQSELATTLRNRVKVALRPAALTKELHGIAKDYFTGAGIPAQEVEKHSPKLRWSKHDIRRGLGEMESEGVLERKTVDGRLVRALSKSERELLSGDQIDIFVWVRPKAEDTETVAAEWQTVLARPDASGTSPEGCILCPPPPSVRLILKVFQIDGWQKEQISTPEYTNRVQAAYEKAKKVFLTELGEGGIKCTPGQEGSESTPEGGNACRSIEIKVERKEKLSSSSSSITDEKSATTTTHTPPSPEHFHRLICERFQEAGKPVPVKSQTDPLLGALLIAEASRNCETLIPAFTSWLGPQKLRPIKHPGALPRLLEEFLSSEAVEEANRARAAAEKQDAEIAALRALAEDPNETPDIQGQCRQRLKELLTASGKEKTSHA